MTHPGPHKRSTIYDVARAAGVSYQTVSRVINNNPNVSMDTRRRVLKVIDELGYRPNRAAQVLNTQRSHVIEVMIIDIYATGPSMDSISSIAKQLGYNVVISVLRPDELEKAVEDALGRSVDGFLLIASRREVRSKRMADFCKGVPFVRLIDTQESKSPSVIYDQRYGAQVAVQHLIDLGHRDIAHLIGTYNNVDAEARHQAWLDTLKKSGLTPGPSAQGNFTPQTGYEASKQILGSGQPFTAIFAANDEMAIGAMSALYEHGLRVPDDISIIGFDDTAFSAYTYPPLTTMRQDWRIMARLAVEYLVEQIEKPDTPIYQRVLMPELIVRRSTRRLNP